MRNPRRGKAPVPATTEDGPDAKRGRTPDLHLDSARSDDQTPILSTTSPGPERAAPITLGECEPAFPVTQWEKYEFLALLGQGGMGAVYKARDRQLDRTTAIKFVLGDKPARVQRFLQEAHAQARLDHPNICRVYEVGQVEGKPYIAMEFVAGTSLDEARGRLSLHEKVQVIRDAALALHEAHRLGIIHRDVKPANIMLERHPDGRLRPVVMDFGLARDDSEQRDLTQTGAVMGTPAYMPPEQARGSGQKLDRRVDVYSLGATLYELLTGRPPFEGRDTVDVLLEVLGKDPPPVRTLVPDIPADLETIALKCLAKEPGQRYDSARALADDLQCYIDGAPIRGRRSTLRYRLRRSVKRHRGLVLLGSAAVVLTLTLGILALRAELRSYKRAQLAQQLGQDVKEMELFMRMAYALPLHDIGREQAVLRKRMEAMQAQLRTADKGTAAALHYGLGRGHLVLREYPEAQRELQAAWQAGYQSREARLALGLALGERYRQEFAEAQRIGNKKWIASRDSELTTQYLKPAMAYLQGADQGIENSLYVQGLLSLYRKQYDQALELAQRAQAETPWLADPLTLQAEVYRLQGFSSFSRGQYREAKDQSVRATALHQAAAAINPSDSAIHEALASDWILIMSADHIIGSPLDQDLKEVNAAADHARIANPRQTSSLVLKSLAAWRVGSARVLHFEKDAKPILQEALALAQQAVELNPKDWQSHYFYSLSIAELGSLPEATEKENAAVLQKSLAALGEALKLNPNLPMGWHDRGSKTQRLLEIEISHGRFSADLFAAAESHYKKAIELSPDYFAPHMDLIDLHCIKIFHLLHHGLDIEAEVSQALLAEQNAVAISPNHFFVYVNGSTALLYKAEMLSWMGEIPAELKAQIEQRLARAQSLAPQAMLTNTNYTSLVLLRAASDLAAGRDPRAAIAEGLKITDKVLKQVPGASDFVLLSAALHSLAGRALGDTPEADAEIRRAVAESRRMAKELQQLGEPHVRLCEVLRHAVAARVRVPQPALAAETTQWLAEGLGECDAALAYDPMMATAHANRGALLLAKAQRERDAEARQSAAAAAREALTRALAINKWRRREWEPLLYAAQALATADRAESPAVLPAPR